MFDFVCANGHKSERLADYESVSFQCECGAQANRALSAPSFKLEGWSGSFPSAHAAFEKKHIDQLKWEQKHNS